jgi:acyl carrier protein
MTLHEKTESILDLIRQWAADHELEVPTDTSTTFADANFDSLHSVELAFFLEEKLGIDVDEAVIWNSATFDALAQHLANRLIGTAAGAQSSTPAPESTEKSGSW